MSLVAPKTCSTTDPQRWLVLLLPLGILIPDHRLPLRWMWPFSFRARSFALPSLPERIGRVASVNALWSAREQTHLAGFQAAELAFCFGFRVKVLTSFCCR